MNEVMDAANFAAQNNLKFEPIFAYINDLERLKKYLKNELSYLDLKKASEDLFLYYYQDYIANVPKGYWCPQYANLTIDQDCKIITCCADSTFIYDKEIYLLDLKDISEVNNIRTASNACKECVKLGVHYLAHNPVIPNYIIGVKK